MSCYPPLHNTFAHTSITSPVSGSCSHHTCPPSSPSPPLPLKAALSAVQRLMMAGNALRGEVLSFLQSEGHPVRGLSDVGAPSGGGFDDRDFRPPTRADSAAKPSKRPSNKRKKSGGSSRSANAEAPLGAAPNGKQRRIGESAKPASAGLKQDETRRAWNEGAGPMPSTLTLVSERVARDVSSAEAADDGDFEGVWYDALYRERGALAKGIKKRKGGNDRARGSQPDQAKQRAQELLESLARRHEIGIKQRGGQDGKWLLAARAKGTMRDKIAAAALLVQQNTAANLSSLEFLLGLVTRNKGSRDSVVHALDALSELFQSCLLPDRRLSFFDDAFEESGHLLPRGPRGDKLLLLWLLEDKLKRCYHDFVGGLENLTKDNLEHLKHKAIKASYALLNSKPEEESWLLSILVNKLGDPGRKTASNVVFYLHRLLDEHPGMKVIVVEAVESFLYRPSVSHRAQYTSVIFLNQLIMSKDEAEGGPKLASKLVNLYFGFFEVLVRRMENETKPKRNGRGSRKALKQHSKGKQNEKDDDAANPQQPSIDSKLLSAILTGINRAFPYVSSNSSSKLISRHSPKLFHLVHSKNFGTAVQALILLHQLFSSKMALSDRYYRALYSMLLSSEVARSSKTPLFLSVLFKSIKADVNRTRSAAIMNRLLQVSSEGKSNFACGILLLMSEVVKQMPALWAFINENDDGCSEHFEDQNDSSSSSSDDERSEEGGESQESQEGAEKGEAGISRGTDESNGDARPYAKGGYNMNKRDPQFSGMEDTCFWELSLFSNHFHPSVAIMAKTLLLGQHIAYNGDPLRDLNLSSFLGKFVSKKPKALNARGIFGKGNDEARVNVDSSDFAKLSEVAVDPADVFFHKFKLTGETKNEETEAEIETAEDTESHRLRDAMFSAKSGEVSESSGELSDEEASDDEDGKSPFAPLEDFQRG